MVLFLREWVLNILSVVLFLALAEILIPTGKTRNFVRLVTGFIMIITILNPLIGVLKNGLSIEDFYLTDEHYLGLAEIEYNRSYFGEEQSEQIIGLYKNKLISQIQVTAEEISGFNDVGVDVIVNEDPHSERFGEIRGVYIKLAAKQQEVADADNTQITIDKIQIDNPADNNNDGGINAGIRKEIETKINQLLGVKKENIIVSFGMK